MIIQNLYDHLASISALTDIVGTDPCKVFVRRVPKEIRDSVGVTQKINPPFIVFSLTGGDPDRHMGGDTGVTTGTFIVSFVSTTWSGVETLFDTFRKAVDTDYATSWGTSYIQRAFVGDATDMTNDPVTGAPVDWPTFESSLEVVYSRTPASP